MATERSDHSAQARLDSITDELSAMNTLIIANATQLPNKLELVDRLIHRCDEMLGELHALRAIYAVKAGDGFQDQESASDVTSLRA